MRIAPRMSMHSGWKASSESSASVSVSSWKAISSRRSWHSSRKRVCCASSLKISAWKGSGSPMGASKISRPSPSSIGSHSATSIGRRVHIRAVRKPSQNSHCGVSSLRLRMSSSIASSSSSASLLSAGLKSSSASGAALFVVEGVESCAAMGKTGVRERLPIGLKWVALAVKRAQFYALGNSSAPPGPTAPLRC